MENFLNQFLRLRCQKNSHNFIYGYYSPISMYKVNFHFIRISRAGQLFVSGGTHHYKNGSKLFELELDAHYYNKQFGLSHKWEQVEPVKSIGEIADVESLIKNMLVLDYYVHGDKMFSTEKIRRKLFAKKKVYDLESIGKARDNIQAIFQGKKPKTTAESIVGKEKLDELLEKSKEFAIDQSLQRELESGPVYDL